MKLKQLSLAAKIVILLVTGTLAASIIISTFLKETPKKNNTTSNVIEEYTTNPKEELSEHVISTPEEESSSQNNDVRANDDTSNTVADYEGSLDLSPNEQAVIHAGYGVVVQLPTGNYGVLTHGDGYVNGVDGFVILENYLSALGLSARTMTGGWISSANDWYWYIAKDPVPIDTSNNEW